MKDTKRRFPPQTIYDRTGIQRELETQAEKGWYLEKCSALGWVYRKGNPQKVPYAVTYFPNADAYDPAPSEELLRFQEFCAHTGWELVSSNAQVQIFRNFRENPIPIETDPVIEVENIHASMKKTQYKSWITGIILAAMNLGLHLWQFSIRPIEFLATNFYLIVVLMWLIMLADHGVQLLIYRKWLKAARANAADGVFTETKAPGFLHYIPLVLAFLLMGLMLWNMPGVNGKQHALLILLGTTGVIGLSVLFTWFMKKNGVDADTNRALSVVMTIVLAFILLVMACGVVFTAKPEAAGERYTVNGYTTYIYHEEIPLKIEDLMDSDYENYSCEILDTLSSPLLNYQWCQQTAMVDAPEEPEMDYTIVDVNAPFLRDWVVEQMLAKSFRLSAAHSRTCQALDAAPWGAVEVYQLVIDGQPWDHYLVCYETRIVKLDLSWTPTPEQMAVICAILNK